MSEGVRELAKKSEATVRLQMAVHGKVEVAPAVSIGAVAGAATPGTPVQRSATTTAAPAVSAFAS